MPIDNWEEQDRKTRRKWVGYFDILGFKEYIEMKDLLTAVEDVKIVFDKAVEEAVRSSYTSFGSDGGKEPIIKRYAFADSVLLYIEPDRKVASEFSYITVASGILVARFMEEGFLLRGAISYGQLFADYVSEQRTMLVIGKGINDANRWQNAQNWAGCTVNPDTTDIWKFLSKTDEGPLDFFRRWGLLLQCQVPLKTNVFYPYNYTVNWTKFLSDGSLEKVKRLLLEKIDTQTNSDVLKKLINTLAFLESEAAKRV